MNAEFKVKDVQILKNDIYIVSDFVLTDLNIYFALI